MKEKNIVEILIEANDTALSITLHALKLPLQTIHHCRRVFEIARSKEMEKNMDEFQKETFERQIGVDEK